MTPDTPVSLPSEVLPELVQYEPTITIVVISYVEPKISGCLDNLLKRILRSDGGLSSVGLVRPLPVTRKTGLPAPKAP